MTPTAGDFMFRFCTDDHPPDRRLLMWHEVFGRTVSRRELSPLADGPFRMDMTVRRLASPSPDAGAETGACVQRMTFSAGFIARRTAELLADGNDDVILHVHESGRRVVSQFGREASVEAGGGLLSSNAAPSTIVLPGPCRFASIGVPRKLMAAVAPDLDDALLRPLPPNTGVLRLLMGYLDALEDEKALETPELRRTAATHLHDLCALALGATREAAEVAQGHGLRAARLRAIKADIAEHLHDERLSAAALAARQRVTTRYIHKLFESEGTTLSKFVCGQRLARVHRMLVDPRHAHRTIGALAFEAGFGDLSTFNREFRRHFGATPSDVRATAREAI